MVETMWSGQLRAFRPQEFVYLIYESNPNFRGYGFKDPYVKQNLIFNKI